MKAYKIDFSRYKGAVRQCILEAVQRHALAIGYTKGYNSKGDIYPTYVPVAHLYLHESAGFGYTMVAGSYWFAGSVHAEISVEDFLALKKEPEYTRLRLRNESTDDGTFLDIHDGEMVTITKEGLTLRYSKHTNTRSLDTGVI